MNLQKLFETQKILDDKIVKEKGLEGVNLLDKKILALQVELGELANEWEMFKFWKDNPKPNTDTFKMVKCNHCKGNVDLVENCETCWGRGAYSVGRKNPLLEEYVDCLHFILSIGNDLGVTYKIHSIKDYKEWNTTQLFNAMYYQLAMFENEVHSFSTRERQQLGYKLVFNVFMSIGKRLGFTTEQIEQAYYAKNKVNHERQNNGY